MKLYVMFVVPPKEEAGARVREVASKVADEVFHLNQQHRGRIELSQDYLQSVSLESLSVPQQEHFDRRLEQIKRSYFDALVLKGTLRSPFVEQALDVAAECGVRIIYDDLNKQPLPKIIERLQGTVLPEEEVVPADSRPVVVLRPVRT